MNTCGRLLQLALAGILGVTSVSEGLAAERRLSVDLEIPARVEEVWDAWTTEGGIRSFFAPDARIDLRVDGLYEIYFDPTAPEGKRGADGMRILVLEPRKRFAFTWNAPEDQSYVRGQRTIVMIELQPVGEDRTLMRFTHSGWGEGQAWDAAFDYFERAWNRHVLARLVHRFDTGPIDWSSPPRLEPVAASIAR